MIKYIKLLFLVIVSFLFVACIQADTKNGFDLSNSIINKDEILKGGPSKDGIPSIDNPKFLNIKDVNYLKDDDIIIGVEKNGKVKAYPTRILVWHEVVNDTIDGEAIVVTYCPLCGTAMVFGREVAGKIRTFGVSGLLYQSDVLMYDRQSESLWSQLLMKAVSGDAVGQEMEWKSSLFMTWKAWKKQYPNSKVLSTDTGFNRNYSRSAYESYSQSEDTMFPVPKIRKEFSNKEWVIGIIVNEKAKAYPVNSLPNNKTIKDKIGDRIITIKYDLNKQHPEVKNSKGENIPSVQVYWFAWQAFYPDTSIWQINN